MGGPPRLRNKMQSGRPRPKTIHVDRRDTPDGTLTPSRGKKGSITNLASKRYYKLITYNNYCNNFYNTHYFIFYFFILCLKLLFDILLLFCGFVKWYLTKTIVLHVALNSQIRRDYYRGSQDCLAETRRTSISSLYSGEYLNIPEVIIYFGYVLQSVFFSTFIV